MILLGGSRGEFISCSFWLLAEFNSLQSQNQGSCFITGCQQSLFPASRVLHALAHGPLLPFSKFWVTSFSHHSSLTSAKEMFSNFKNSPDYTEHAEMIQDNLPISKSGTLMTSAESVLPWKVTRWETLGIRTWTSLGAIIQHTAFKLLLWSYLSVSLNYASPSPDLKISLRKPLRHQNIFIESMQFNHKRTPFGFYSVKFNE